MIKIGNCYSAKPKPTVAHESVIAKPLNRSRVAHILFCHHYNPFMAKLSLYFLSNMPAQLTMILLVYYAQGYPIVIPILLLRNKTYYH